VPQATDVVSKIDALIGDQGCWCSWSPLYWAPLSHDDYIVSNEYPEHEVAAEWNLAEPDESYECWDAADSPDAASSEADDLDREGAMKVTKTHLINYPRWRHRDLGRDVPARGNRRGAAIRRPGARRARRLPVDYRAYVN
jgi:hypothetical protein